jgi:hypothetical protein
VLSLYQLGQEHDALRDAPGDAGPDLPGRGAAAGAGRGAGGAGEIEQVLPLGLAELKGLIGPLRRQRVQATAGALGRC